MRRDLRRRLRGWTLLATFMCAFGTSQLSADHFGITDSACGDVALAGDQGPRIGVAVGESAEHCPVCHFLRAVNGAEIMTVARVAAPQLGALLTATASQGPPAIETSVRSSRGPPAGLLSQSSCV